MSGGHRRPPAILKWLASTLVVGPDARFILDDLEEDYARECEGGSVFVASAKYVWATLRSAWATLSHVNSRQTNERSTQMRFGMSWLDWKLGGRMLVKYPGLTVIGGLAMAAAIGLGAAWFEVTQQYAKPHLPFTDGDRIVRVELFDAAASRVEPRALYDLQLWRLELTSIDQLGAYRTFERNLITADGNAQPTKVAEISPSAFPLTDVAPLLGRTLSEADAQPGSAEAVVIGYDVWQSRFNGERDVIGRAVSLAHTPATIVGVMPEGFRFPSTHQVWVPLRLASTQPLEGLPVSIFGRLTDGATLESAQAELTTIGQSTAAQHATTHAQLRPRISLFAAPRSGRLSRTSPGCPTSSPG